MSTILHLIGTLGQFDASVRLRLLAQSQAAAGSEVRLVTFSASAAARNFKQQSQIPCEVIRKRWDYDPFAARQLVQLLQECRPDEVYLWGRRATDAAITVRRALPEATLIATLAEVPQLRNPWWPNKSLDAVDLIVTEQDQVRQEFVDAGQGEAKVRVIPPGVPPAAPVARTRRELLLQLGLSSESRIIAVAAPLERAQLVDEAIWCFELIRILHDHAALVIVGDGPERSRLERFARQATDTNVVRFIPNVELLAEVLANAEIYWQPGASRWIPSSLLAAMQQNVPVIVADTPTHRLVVQEGVDGLLIPPAKRAVWARQTDLLMRDMELRRSLAVAAQETVNGQFIADQMIVAYDQLVIGARTAKSFA